MQPAATWLAKLILTDSCTGSEWAASPLNRRQLSCYHTRFTRFPCYSGRVAERPRPVRMSYWWPVPGIVLSHTLADFPCDLGLIMGSHAR